MRARPFLSGLPWYWYTRLQTAGRRMTNRDVRHIVSSVLLQLWKSNNRELLATGRCTAWSFRTYYAIENRQSISESSRVRTPKRWSSCTIYIYSGTRRYMMTTHRSAVQSELNNSYTVGRRTTAVMSFETIVTYYGWNETQLLEHLLYRNIWQTIRAHRHACIYIIYDNIQYIYAIWYSNGFETLDICISRDVAQLSLRSCEFSPPRDCLTTHVYTH